MSEEERARRAVLLGRFQTARSALFDVESGMSPDIDNGRRRAVYTLRRELGIIENAEFTADERECLLRPSVSPSPPITEPKRKEE